MKRNGSIMGKSLSRIGTPKAENPGILSFNFMRFGYSGEHGRKMYVKPHVHQEYELLIADSGLYTCAVNGVWMDFEPGQGILVKPGDEHEDEYGPDVRFYVMAFSIRASGFDEGQASVFREDSSPIDQRFERGVGLHREAMSRYEEARDFSPDFLGQIQDSLLLLLFWNIIRCFEPEYMNPSFYEVSQAHSFPNQLNRMFRSNMHDMLTVAEMADKMLMSESTFAHTCKEIIGISPYKAYMKAKMERACHFLEDSDWTMKEISNELGFKDQYTFSRTFKNHFGISPRAWRNKSGGKGQDAGLVRG
jgi:AraC-like DNA-binding protein